MIDTSPLLCSADAKAELEARNALLQLDYIAYLVNDQKQVMLREMHVMELHRLAIQDIYPCAGMYRDAIRQIRIDGSRHAPPEAWQVQSLVKDMVERAGQISSVLLRAAYVLWRFNWIHPFAGGNGRTARALAYLVICMEHGAALPGVPSVPTTIYADADRYTRGLREADAADVAGKEDLNTLLALIGDAAVKQAMSALKEFAASDRARTGG